MTYIRKMQLILKKKIFFKGKPLPVAQFVRELSRYTKVVGSTSHNHGQGTYKRQPVNA